MKIILVGAWYTSIYEEPLARSFKILGHEVYEFKSSSYFRNVHLDHYRHGTFSLAEIFYYKFQNKFLVGPVISKINNDLFDLCSEVQPDLIFFYRALFIRSRTIRKIKNVYSAKLTSYHNDDPFTAGNKWRNRHYISSLRSMDFNYVYRPKNLLDVQNLSKHCEILLPYPNTDFIHPLENCEKKYDVVFIGHYEDDGRDQFIMELIFDNSINFMLFGTDWYRSPFYPEIKEKLGETGPVYGENYNITLNQTKMALCFFSRINNDQYTRRTFEIPSAGTMLFSQFSKESAELFKPDVEAVYFQSTSELLKKAHYYLKHDEKRKTIARNGFQQVFDGGHTSMDRAKQILGNLDKNIKLEAEVESALNKPSIP